MGLMGDLELAGVQGRLESLIRGEPDFGALTSALGHLLYLFRYDHFLRRRRGARRGGLARGGLSAGAVADAAAGPGHA